MDDSLALGSLPHSGALLAIDPGERRVGVAVCGRQQITVRPLVTLERKPHRRLLSDLGKIVMENGVVGGLVGVALLESGGRGVQAQRAQTLFHHLRGAFGQMKWAMWDERHSSVEAGKALLRADAGDREAGLDAAAAAVILQGFLDARGQAEA